VFECKKEEVTGNKGFGFDSDRYCFGDFIKDDNNRCSILHRQRGLEIAENNELSKLKWMCRHGML
jgi:hypothetical protein